MGTQRTKRKGVESGIGSFALITTGVLMLILAVTLEAQPVAGTSGATESHTQVRSVHKQIQPLGKHVQLLHEEPAF